MDNIVRRLKQILWLIALMQINLSALAFSELIIFGDSLSDTGNHPAAIFGAPPPYYKNRISNGPVAVDIFANALGLTANHSGFLFANGSGLNYAVSGANAAGSDPHDLTAQLQAYLKRAPAILDANALYLIMIGGNDLRDASVLSSESQATEAIARSLQAIQAAILQLLSKGAKNVLVSNAPDISRIPETTQRAASHSGLHVFAASLVDDFNRGLKDIITRVQTGVGARVQIFDLFGHFNDILKRPAFYDFSNSTEACFNYDSFDFHPQCDFDQFVFFDSIHPGAKAHKILGLEMAKRVDSKSVPAINFPQAILFLLLQ
jgi:phospholipase/lecithinase/hemolysin